MYNQQVQPQPMQPPMYQQPQPMYHQQHQSVTNVVINQPTQNQGLLLSPPKGNRDWTSGLFACCIDFGGVLKACCCMECLIMALNSRAGECAVTHWCVPGALIALRTKVRTMGGISGSMLHDCAAINCCFPCAICQMDRELTAMGL